MIIQKRKKKTRERDSKDFKVKKKDLIVDDEIVKVFIKFFMC